MNQGSGFILIILGLLLLYVVITGKFDIIEHAFYQLFGLEDPNFIDKDTAARAAQAAGNSIRAADAASQAAGVTITLPQIFVPNYTK